MGIILWRILVSTVASLYHNSSSFYIVQCIKFILYIGIFAIILLLLHTLAMEKHCIKHFIVIAHPAYHMGKSMVAPKGAYQNWNKMSKVTRVPHTWLGSVSRWEYLQSIPVPY